jgi:hypothetical protein
LHSAVTTHQIPINTGPHIVWQMASPFQGALHDKW